MVPGEARRPPRRYRTLRHRARLQRPAVGPRRRHGAARVAVEGKGAQPHRPGLDADLEHDRRRLDADPPRCRRHRVAVPAWSRLGVPRPLARLGGARERWDRLRDKPLYDYVQHAGRSSATSPSPRAELPAARSAAWLRARRGMPTRWRSIYFRTLAQLELQAAILLERCGEGMPARSAGRLSGCSSSIAAGSCSAGCWRGRCGPCGVARRRSAPNGSSPAGRLGAGSSACARGAEVRRRDTPPSQGSLLSTSKHSASVGSSAGSRGATSSPSRSDQQVRSTSATKIATVSSFLANAYGSDLCRAAGSA